MAEAQYLDQVQQLYIAYFGRPADPAGLVYWAQQIDRAGGNMSVAISGFSASAESTALYGNVTPEQQVIAIYQNLFGRAPEPAGLAYWTNVIASGGSASDMAFRVLQAAQGSDAAVIGNKLAAANAFTAAIDTAAEISGYRGADALAAARAFLSKVDATPASIANLAVDAATAVGKATGTGGGDTGTGGSSSPPFAAIKDAGTNEVTLTHGTHITMTLVGGTYTFTSGGTNIDIAGPVTGIKIPTGATLSTDLATAGTISFPDAGTLVLTDTAASATELKDIEAATTGLVNASAVTALTGATSAADAQLLLVTNNGSSGDRIKTAVGVTLTLSDTTADAAVLKAIETHTTGLVGATSVASITHASTADAKQLLITNRGTTGDKIDLAADVAVTLTGPTATAADLKAIEVATTGLVEAGNVTSITDASMADAQQLLVTDNGTSGDKIHIRGSVAVTLSDTTGDATALTAIEAATTGWVDARSITSITDATANQAQNLLFWHRGDSPIYDGIRFADTVAVTVTSTSMTGAVLGAIAIGATANGMNATVDASQVTQITNATVAAALAGMVTHKDNVTLGAGVTVGLTRGDVNAADLSAIEAATSGLVSFTNANSTISGTVQEVLNLYTHRGTTGDAIDIAGGLDITVSDAGAYNASGLKLVDAYTLGQITASNLTGISGSVADLKTVLEANTGNGTAHQLSIPLLSLVKVTDSITDAATFDHVVFANDTELRLFSNGSNSLTLNSLSVATGKTLTIDASTTNGLDLDARAITDSSVSLIVKTDGGGDISSGTSIWGGSGADTFTISQQSTGNVICYDATNMSTLAHMDVVKNYWQSGGAIFDLNFASIAKNSTVFDETGKSSLADALNDVASSHDNGNANELYVFTLAGNTYLYVESSAAVTAYASGDFVLEITGTPFEQGASVGSLGLFLTV